MKFIGLKSNEIATPIVVEATSVEIRNDTEFDRERMRNGKFVLVLKTPYNSYNIISSKVRKDSEVPSGGWRWLSKEEAMKVIEYAAQNDVIDLRTLGGYAIHCNGDRYIHAIVMNDYDEFSDREIPLLVKTIDDEDDEYDEDDL